MRKKKSSKKYKKQRYSSETKNTRSRKILKSSHGRRSEHPEMEKKLANWVVNLLQKGIKVTQSDIRKKALMILKKEQQE